MTIKDKIQELAGRNKAELQRARNKRPADSSRDVPTLLKYAEQLDQVFKHFGILCTLETIHDTKGFMMDDKEDGEYYLRMANMIINDEFKALTTNEIIHETFDYVSKNKLLKKQVKAIYEEPYLYLFTGDEPIKL